MDLKTEPIVLNKAVLVVSLNAGYGVIPQFWPVVKSLMDSAGAYWESSQQAEGTRPAWPHTLCQQAFHTKTVLQPFSFML